MLNRSAKGQKGKTKRISLGDLPYKHWLIYGLGIILLAAIAYGTQLLLSSKDLPIRVVRIEGSFTHVSRAKLRAQLLPLVQKGFFVVDVDAIQESLLDMPWIAKASVRRVWPNKLSIRIVEQVPVARWNNQMLMNASGDVFVRSNATEFNQLPSFVGPKGLQKKMLQQYKRMTTVLQGLHLAISQMVLTAPRSWQLTLNNGMTLELGRGQAFNHLLRFVGIYNRVFARRAAEVDYVDLRYPNGMAVRWKTT